MEFNLERWGDGTIHLTHEDRLYGQDIDILLHQDGTAHLVDYAEQGIEARSPINLIAYLCQLATTPQPPPDAERGRGV